MLISKTSTHHILLGTEKIQRYNGITKCGNKMCESRIRQRQKTQKIIVRDAPKRNCKKKKGNLIVYSHILN